MEFIDFFLEYWLDGNLLCPKRETVADIVFSDQQLADRAKELVDATPELNLKKHRQWLYTNMACYAQRFQLVLERAKEDPTEDAPS